MRGRRYFSDRNGDTVVLSGELNPSATEREGAVIGPASGLLSAAAADDLIEDLLAHGDPEMWECRSRLLEIGAMEMEETDRYSLDALRQEIASHLSGSLPRIRVIRAPKPRQFFLPKPRQPHNLESARRRSTDTAEPAVAVTWLEAACFVPAVEDLGIAYEISGPLSKVRTLRLVIASQASPDTAIFEAEIPAASNQAKGVYRWDGAAEADGGIADLKGSPYQAHFTLTSTSGQNHESNKVGLAVEVHSVEIEVADPEEAAVPPEDRVALADLRHDLLTNKSSEGATAKLVRTVPWFKYREYEMYDDGAFTSWRRRWGNNLLLVPLVATVWLRGKDGQRRTSVKATEGTRVLWRARLRDGAEFDDATADRQLHGTARRFVKAANAHAHAECRPPGWAAHHCAGGIKASPGDVEGNSPSRHRWRNMEWPCRPPENRPWDLFTRCGDYSFNVSGNTGVWFWGGHVAGDAHKIEAIIDLHETLDVSEDDPVNSVPAALRSNSITIENWRHVPIVRELALGRCRADWPTIQRAFEKASLLVGPRSDVPAEDFTEKWTEFYQLAIADLKPRSEYFAAAILDNPAPYAVRFREFGDYWAHLERKMSWLARAFRRTFEESHYQQKCETWALKVCELTATKMADTVLNGGVTLVTFDTDRVHNQVRGPRTVGFAPDIRDAERADRAVVLLFNTGSADATSTLIHEIGHALFLAHAPGSFDADHAPGGADPTQHDPDQLCIMSYDPGATSFCGFCLLKLAGWNPMAIKTDGTLRAP